jgi:pimeloyl-ACP methyl ester carboxylesterase
MSTGTHLAIHRTGTGAPLVLLHALGSSSHSWEPVLPYLVDGFEVLAVDLPGFGASPAPAGSEHAAPAALAAAVDVALGEAGIHDPHVVGNSLGGWVALELAHLRPVASLTLLSPAGMWAGDTPWYCRLSLRGTRWLTQHAQRLLDRLVEHRLGRILALGQTHGHPTRVSPDQARAAVHEMASCAGFDAALEATRHLHYRRRDDDRSQPPTTVAFGSRDRLLLLPQWRGTGELPADAVVGRLPGCGHIPMYDDPAAVVRLITDTVTRSRPSAEAPATTGPTQIRGT